MNKLVQGVMEKMESKLGIEKKHGASSEKNESKTTERKHMSKVKKAVKKAVVKKAVKKKVKKAVKKGGY